jgi:hypothetical protein
MYDGYGTGKLPKLPFPVFDGDNPRHWIRRVEDYFDLYGVEQLRWIKLATMNFSPAAARWLPSVEKRLQTCSWEEFRRLLLDRFGREHHELLVRQLLSIKKTSAVSEYIDRFSVLVDQLSAYNSQADPLYYIMCFIDGLTEELRAPVLIQRPSILDTAFVLAQLQEEVAPPPRKKEFRKPDYAPTARSSSYWPLPPPPRLEKASNTPADERHNTDHARARSTDERLAALRAYLRAQGLCQHCAEKWVRRHKCAEKIQLHALQEILDIFQLVDDPEEVSDIAEAGNQLFATISVAAVSGLPTPKTVCLKGSIQNIQIRILVDSGSSHTFISTQLASQL